MKINLSTTIYQMKGKHNSNTLFQEEKEINIKDIEKEIKEYQNKKKAIKMLLEDKIVGTIEFNLYF